MGLKVGRDFAYAIAFAAMLGGALGYRAATAHDEAEEAQRLVDRSKVAVISLLSSRDPGQLTFHDVFPTFSRDERVVCGAVTSERFAFTWLYAVEPDSGATMLYHTLMRDEWLDRCGFNRAEVLAGAFRGSAY